MPLPEVFLDQIKNPDNFLVCFPRSGSRWLMLLLADLVNQQLGKDPAALYSQQIEFEADRASRPTRCLPVGQLIPNAYLGSRRSPERATEIIRPLFKSHNLVQPWQRSEGFVIYLFRRPDNCLYSYYNHLKAKGRKAVEGVDIDSFFPRFLSQWEAHVSLALTAAQLNPERILFLEYQRKQPFHWKQLQLAAYRIGLVPTKEQLTKASRRFSKFLAAINRGGDHTYERSRNVRIRQFLSPETVDLMETVTGVTYKEASKSARFQLRTRRRFLRESSFLSER